MKLLEFARTTNAFCYNFEKDLATNETVIVKMPSVSANKRGINDIGWLCNGDVTMYGTLSKNPTSEKALWQEFRVNDEINKTVAFLKIKNNGDACRIEIRAILN